MAVIHKKTRWGTTIGTGAADIDYMLIAALRPMSEQEIEDTIRKLGIKPRGEVLRHLYTLRKRGHIVNTAFGWARIRGPKHPSESPHTGTRRKRR